MKIPIVNEQDEIIGYKERENKGPEDIFRVTGLWVTDKDGNILLAQRSFKKKGGPGLWGPAVAGTVEEGETYESNMTKEAEEEIGLIGLKLTPGPKIRSAGKKYFIHWFTVVIDHDYPFKKQEEEVESLQWFTKEQISKLVKEKPEIFVPYFEQYINH
jgi:isopentenyldiphosphate isomerase